MKVRVTIEREFEMDEKRVLAESSFEPPPGDATADEKQRWLQESFFELCGFDRDQDHIDGSYVWSTGLDYEDTDFDWPVGLK